MGDDVSRDYWSLCLACGVASQEDEWTYWQREDTEDGLDLRWRPSLDGEGDPMMRCPSCGWEHVDDDSGPGIFDGTRFEVATYRREQEHDYADMWAEARVARECRAKSWQLDGFAICRERSGHDGGHVRDVQ